jgi:hypothetical protein
LGTKVAGAWPTAARKAVAVVVSSTWEREERKREERGEEEVHAGSSFQPVVSNGLT